MKVIETKYLWLIRSPCPCKEHTIPRSRNPQRTWNFDGNLESPTFAPSVSETRGEGHRCHYVVTAGKIAFQSDCSHDLRGTTHDLIDWPQETVDYYAALEKESGQA